MPDTRPTHGAIRLQDAIASAPVLARLGEIAAESTARMALIAPLLPPGLRELVRPGLAEPHSWCLLVPHSAAAAKLRQMLPTLLLALQAGGHPVQQVRVKVAGRGR